MKCFDYERSQRLSCRQPSTQSNWMRNTSKGSRAFFLISTFHPSSRLIMFWSMFSANLSCLFSVRRGRPDWDFNSSWLVSLYFPMQNVTCTVVRKNTRWFRTSQTAITTETSSILSSLHRSCRTLNSNSTQLELKNSELPLKHSNCVKKYFKKIPIPDLGSSGILGEERSGIWDDKVYGTSLGDSCRVTIEYDIVRIIHVWYDNDAISVKWCY